MKDHASPDPFVRCKVSRWNNIHEARMIYYKQVRLVEKHNAGGIEFCARENWPVCRCYCRLMETRALTGTPEVILLPFRVFINFLTKSLHPGSNV